MRNPYNTPPMSKRLPLEINPIRFVESRQIIEGDLPIGHLTRLSELVLPLPEGSEDTRVLYVKLVFYPNEVGKPSIKGQVSGAVELECQRCLEPLEFEINSEISVVLVTTDTEAGFLQEGYDTWLLEEERLFLPDFVEDEVMLSLPLIYTHKDCETSRPLIEANPEDEIKIQQGDNPFAVLKQFKK